MNEKADSYNGYQLRFDLENEIKARIVIFDHGEQKHHYEYDYRLYGEDRRLELLNELKLFVEYIDGVAMSCNLSMNIVFPKRLGATRRYGMDLSKNSKLDLTFEYKKEVRKENVTDENRTGSIFRLERVFSGVKCLYERSEKGEGLIVQHDFPFPVPDIIKLGDGRYNIPFLFRDGNKDIIRQIEFVDNIQKIHRIGC